MRATAVFWAQSDEFMDQRSGSQYVACQASPKNSKDLQEIYTYIIMAMKKREESGSIQNLEIGLLGNDKLLAELKIW